MKRLSVEDLEYVFLNTKGIWESLRGKSIFLTGGTGFFGKWLLESFIYVNQKLKLNASITVLSRNPESFLNEYPFYRDCLDAIHFIKGDILRYDFSINKKFQYIIHAATSASDFLNKSNPLLMMDTIIGGTRRMLDFSLKQPIESFLFVSSGAIYGQQPSNISHITESDSFKVDINNSTAAYSEGKRIAELYSSTYYEKYHLPVKIARCFAFIGPYLPLNSHFAIGNFIRNIINGQEIVITGDGRTIRSYMYASDLAISIWKILLIGERNKPYNVGSDQLYSLIELASIIKDIYGNNFKILGNSSEHKINIYVPNIDLLKSELNLKNLIPIDIAIRKTVEFNKVL